MKNMHYHFDISVCRLWVPVFNNVHRSVREPLYRTFDNNLWAGLGGNTMYVSVSNNLRRP